MNQQIDYENSLHDHNSDCSIYEEVGNDDNNDNKHNIIQDTECYDNTGKYNHNNIDNNNKNRNNMELRTHEIKLVKTKKDEHRLWAPNKEKYYLTDKVTVKEPKWILQAEDDEQFVKG